MTISGLLMLGAAEVVDSTTQELLGYAFTIAHGKGQIQRWLLFQNPRNHFEIRSPSAAMGQWSLEDWQQHVPTLWRPNSFYVWANAAVYEYGSTYEGGVTWTQIPPADELPRPEFLEIPGTNYQLDYAEGRVIDVYQEGDRGYAYVVRGLEKDSSIEYWLLRAKYKPAGSIPTRVSIGNDTATTLERFVSHCQASWIPGATFVITACLNYKNVNPPFAP